MASLIVTGASVRVGETDVADGQSVRDLIEAFGQTVPDGVMMFDDDGRAAFAAAEGLVIGIDHVPSTNEILLHAEIGHLPRGAAGQAVLDDLVQGSVPLAASVGGSFAVDKGRSTVAILARRNVESLALPAFETWVADVTEAAKIWTRRLAPPEGQTA